MPSHIYVRVGQYEDAVQANVRASLADETYIEQCAAQGLYPGGYYPHNVHFLWYAHSLQGAGDAAIRTAKKVADIALDLRCGAIEGPRLRYLHVLAMAQFGRWDAVLAEPMPAAEYPFDRMMTHFARALARIGQDDIEAARGEQRRFLEVATPEMLHEVGGDAFPAALVAGVGRHVLQGKLALARGEHDSALEHLTRAVEVEAEIPYMEPPFWHHSAKWSLGAAQLIAGRPAEAEATFRSDLEWLPRNGWALHGLAVALRRQGKTGAADMVDAALKKAWRHADTTLDWSLY